MARNPTCRGRRPAQRSSTGPHMRASLGSIPAPLGSALVDAQALDPQAEVGELVLRLAGEQVDQAALDALALEQRAVDLAARSASRRLAVGQRERRIDRVGALGDARQRRLDVGPAAALRELDAQPVVPRQPGRARRDDVADPGEARRTSAGWRRPRCPSRVISARPRVISPALPLSPKPEAVGRARGDRDDVLQRAAQLDADDVRRSRRAGTRGVPTARLIRRASSWSSAPTTADAGSPRAISAARFGPDRAAIRARVDAARRRR